MLRRRYLERNNKILDDIFTEWRLLTKGGVPYVNEPYHLVLLERAMDNLDLPSWFDKKWLMKEIRVDEKFFTDLVEEEVKPHGDSELIRKLGARKTNVSDGIVNDVISGKYKDEPLSGAGSSYNVNKSNYSYDDLKKEVTNQPDKKLYITTAGTVVNVRSQYGERICHMNVSTSNNPKTTYMGQISVLYKLSKLSGIEIVNKVAAGIGYEKMQIDNLDTHLNAMIGKGHRPLPLYINGKDTGVDIDGGAKVKGSPKAD